MAGIIHVNQVAQVVRQIKKQGKKIVLAGGCFDILHPGHLVFLQKAKKQADILIVLLESDEKVKKLKGVNRPVHLQKDRAKALSQLPPVGYVLMLPYLASDRKYDRLISRIRPDVIAVSAKDINTHHHQRSAKLVGAKMKVVTKTVKDHSTSSLVSDVTGTIRT